MALRFHKMHGLGNDFVVIDARAAPIAMDARRAHRIADRREGIGCDQLILLEASDRADARMRIFNADGGEVEACGNASRCVALLLGGRSTVETLGGLIALEAETAGASVDMGAPRFDWHDIPLAYPIDTLAMPVSWEELERPAAVNVGNPHVVFFVDDVGNAPIREAGPVVERHPLFPEHVNVGFAQIKGRDRIRLRVWERGAGLTQACGTGACAALVAAARRDLTDRTATLELDGGELLIEWRAADDHVIMTGPAAVDFAGELP